MCSVEVEEEEAFLVFKLSRWRLRLASAALAAARMGLLRVEDLPAMAPMASSTDDRPDLEEDVLVEKDAPEGVGVDWNLRMKGWAFVWMGDGATSAEDGFVEGAGVGGAVEVDLKRRGERGEW